MLKLELADSGDIAKLVFIDGQKYSDGDDDRIPKYEIRFDDGDVISVNDIRSGLYTINPRFREE